MFRKEESTKRLSKKFKKKFMSKYFTEALIICKRMSDWKKLKDWSLALVKSKLTLPMALSGNTSYKQKHAIVNS